MLDSNDSYSSIHSHINKTNNHELTEIEDVIEGSFGDVSHTDSRSYNTSANTSKSKFSSSDAMNSSASGS